MPKQIKVCPVCGISSKALHFHLKKHTQEEIEVAAFKSQVEANASAIKPVEPISEPLEGKDIPITPEMTETPAEVEPVTNVNNCEYQLILNINNEKLECFTNNLKISILSYARPVATDGFITIRKGTAEFVKKMSLIQLKQLFADPQSLEIFCEQFYGLYGRPISEQRVNNLI
jgi:hypothetical protein